MLWPRLADCARGTRTRRRLTLRTHGQHTVLMGARRWDTTAGFAALSAARAGVEGTASQAVRSFGLRRPRHVGRAKTHLQHVAAAAAAAAMNLVRLPSLRHYLIVWADKQQIAHHRRGDDGTIDTQTVTTGEIRFVPPGIAISVEDIYVA